MLVTGLTNLPITATNYTVIRYKYFFFYQTCCNSCYFKLHGHGGGTRWNTSLGRHSKQNTLTSVRHVCQNVCMCFEWQKAGSHSEVWWSGDEGLGPRNEFNLHCMRKSKHWQHRNRKWHHIVPVLWNGSWKTRSCSFSMSQLKWFQIVCFQLSAILFPVSKTAMREKPNIVQLAVRHLSSRQQGAFWSL